MLTEIVNPSHPDKIADRIAGAMVDLAYKKQERPKVAIEVLIGHGSCHIIAETSVSFSQEEVEQIVERITASQMFVDYKEFPQDVQLAKNQSHAHYCCGDNGIFCGVYPTAEERELARLVKFLYEKFPTDGKFISNNGLITACQSCANGADIKKAIKEFADKEGVRVLPHLINPLGDWTGGTDVDTGATNRKLGSDMGRAVTGGGLHGKDLSKADVSVNIMCHLLAKRYKKTVRAACAIGDAHISFDIGTKSHSLTVPYDYVVGKAEGYITGLGGFEKLAEWGLNHD